MRSRPEPERLGWAQAGATCGAWLLGRGIGVAAPTDSVARALSGIQFCRVFVENTVAHEALRNSGQLGIISDQMRDTGVLRDELLGRLP